MIEKNIIFGGILTKGDFVIVSGGNYLQFGWYIGPGNGTIQYFSTSSAYITETNYNNWLINKKIYWGKKFSESGLKLSNIKKDYVLDHHKYKIMKFEGDPETIFTEQTDLDKYRNAKALLEKLNFLT